MAGRSSSWQPACYSGNICDSLTFTVVAELLADGKTPYVESIRREHIARTRLGGDEPPFDLPFQYPPNALPLFAWRAWMSPRAAHVGLAFAGTLLFVLPFVALVRERVGPGPAVLLTIGVSTSSFVDFNAQLGQTGLVAAALVTAMALWWTRAPVATGVLLGLLAFKPQYAAPLLLVALVRREHRIVVTSIATFAAVLLLSAAWFGFDEWRHFAAAAREPNHTLPWMVNWMGIAWRIAPGAQASIQGAAIPVFALGMVAAAAALRATRDRASLEGQLAFVLAWAAFLSPNTHPYDFLVLSPALVHLARAPRGARVGPLFFALSWLALPPSMRWILSLALVGLWLLCTRTLGRERDRTLVETGSADSASTRDAA